jgi:hypothetical protein
MSKWLPRPPVGEEDQSTESHLCPGQGLDHCLWLPAVRYLQTVTSPLRRNGLCGSCQPTAAAARWTSTDLTQR